MAAGKGCGAAGGARAAAARVCLLWAWSPALAVANAPAMAACVADGGQPARVAAVEPGLELRLADGRLLRLVGVDPAAQTPSDPDLGDTVRSAMSRLVEARTLSLTIPDDKPDRWGRVAALVAVREGGAEAESLAVAALAAGLGRFLAEPGAHGCREALLHAEAAARAARRGLWRDPYYAVLAPDDLTGFRERSATLVVGVGRVAAVESSQFRTLLRLAPGAPGEGADAAAGAGRAPAREGAARDRLAAAIPPRTLKLFAGQGVDVQTLLGRTVRLRGLLDLRFGPRIELAGPDAVEILGGGDDGATAATPPAATLPAATPPAASPPAAATLVGGG